jgi:hypothetical protein
LKGQVLKRRYAQGWNFARRKSSTAYFFLFQARGCSNFVEKLSATTGCAKTPSQSANSISEDWVTLITIAGTQSFSASTCHTRKRNKVCN